MTLFKKKVAPATGGKIENVLGANTTYHGTIKSDGNIRIDGVFEGHIETAGNVIIGPSAQVIADIVANAAQVWGAVRGDVKTQGRLEILPNGRVWGDIQVASLLIDEGGLFRGQCVMAGEDVEPTVFESGPDEAAQVEEAAEKEGGEDALESAEPSSDES